MSNEGSIIKNTFFLYARLFFSMVISFYASRVLLRELGVEDYGVYNIVGSLVAIFSSLKGFLTSSTQRFLNYEMGAGNYFMLNKIFNMSLVIHLGIAFVFILLVEVFGLWLFFNVLVIPEDTFVIAFWVFQISTLTVVVSIMTVPYDSVLIANEKMGVFSILSVLDNILKLVSVVLLFVIKENKLLYYSIFVLISSFVVRFISANYCRRKFSECVYRFNWDKCLFRKMSKFAGWQFLGNTSFAIQNQGLNMVLNVYFGPVLNAARGIAMQANMAINSFIQNMMIAINPQLTKKYGEGKYEDFFDLFYKSSKYSFGLFSVLSFPVFLFADGFLLIWLGNVPEYVVVFLRLLILYSLIRVLHNPVDSVFKSHGNIKKYQIIDSLVLLLSLPLTLFFYEWGKPPYYMYISMILIETLNLVLILKLSIKVVGLNIKTYFRKVLKPLSVVGFFYIICACLFFEMKKGNAINDILLGIFIYMLYILTVFCFLFSEKEKYKIKKNIFRI